jgi:SAM-dependent methyltransferase
MSSSADRAHFVRDYNTLVNDLFDEHSADEAASLAVGGAYEIVGRLQIALLQYLGLRPIDDIVDVGCGSGRYASLLESIGFRGKYFGIDVVSRLLDYAKTKTPDNFKFELVDGLYVPAPDLSADVVTVFSVFTHLLHEESYVYMQDMARVLRPGGKIIFSFHEFASPKGLELFWNVVDSVKSGNKLPCLNICIERNVISIWADRLGLKIERFIRADEKVIPMEPAFHDSESAESPVVSYGQSVCVLIKS